MFFEEALGYLKGGHFLARTGWNGKGMWLHVQDPDEHSKMGRPYIYLRDAEGKLVPWIASQTDLFADDWELFFAYETCGHCNLTYVVTPDGQANKCVFECEGDRMRRPDYYARIKETGR